jgi:uncharacterized damage-inducible protein DinB
MKDDLLALYEYNAWANERVIGALLALPGEDYVRDMGGGWPSVRATFVHIAGATDAWAERFAGRDAMRLTTVEELPALEDAVGRLHEAQRKHDAHLKTLTPEKTAAAFSWKNLKGELKTAPLWAVLRHVVNHQTYHRGQISSMLRRLGAKPVSTDMVVWGIVIHEAGMPAGR